MQIISLNEAAARASVSRRTLIRAIARGEGPPAFRLSRRRVGVDEADFEAWLLSRKKSVAARTAQPVEAA
jgi:predicted DNA-binding transcriptional regulator AlpA